MNKSTFVRYLLYPILICIGWYWMSSYTFNEKPDLNGDNIYYYVAASSLATGHGYSDLSKLGNPPTATYPPGYPILMTPIRMITDSFVAQKWLNEVFILFSLLLLYFTLIRIKLPDELAFVVAFAGAFLPRLLHFSTMMMSESAFCLTGILALYFLLRMSDDESSWYSELKHPWIYLLILSLALNYQVRTQGLALMAGIGFCMLVRRRWGALLVTMAGSVLGMLPWMLRNKALGLGNTRYLDMVMVANPWRPEEGAISIPEFIARFFQTLKMLVFSAIPNTVIPFVNINPDQPEYSFSVYCIGAIMMVLIILGCWQMGKLRWAMLGYIAATLGIISVFSTPSGSRYITSILPLLTIAELVGLWWLVTWLLQKAVPQMEWGKYSRYCAFFMLPLILLAKPGLQQEHEMSNQRYPLPYQQFFNIGKELKKNTPENTVICSRKSQMLWMYAKRPGTGYLFTSDDKALIRDLIEKKVDYVILDALGYSSTGLYLFPAIQKNAQYFPIVMQYDNTHTYLLRFLREKAEQDGL